MVARELFEFWKATCPGRTKARYTTDRYRRVLARLAEGYTADQIRDAIRGAAAGAFVNDAGRRFDDLELICRSGSKLESFIGREGKQTDRWRKLGDDEAAA